jgi:transposase
MRRLKDFVPADPSLRVIRELVNEALVTMGRLFSKMYEADIKGRRPSIAPEKLLRAMLLQVLYSVRSERQLMEQTCYTLLFRWFIALAIGRVRQVMVRGIRRVAQVFVLTMAAYNMTRMRSLEEIRLQAT